CFVWIRYTSTTRSAVAMAGTTETAGPSPTRTDADRAARVSDADTSADACSGVRLAAFSAGIRMRLQWFPDAIAMLFTTASRETPTSDSVTRPDASGPTITRAPITLSN